MIISSTYNLHLYAINYNILTYVRGVFLQVMYHRLYLHPYKTCMALPSITDYIYTHIKHYGFFIYPDYICTHIKHVWLCLLHYLNNLVFSYQMELPLCFSQVKGCCCFFLSSKSCQIFL
jgi:hypothetical protein